jgi:hypothetical protein
MWVFFLCREPELGEIALAPDAGKTPTFQI